MRKFSFVGLFLFFTLLATQAETFVPFNEKNLSYMGRVEFVENQSAKIYWPGTTVTIDFIGTEVKAILKNGKNPAYFYAIIDGDDLHAKRIKPDTIKSGITLASGLSEGKHRVQLFKLDNNTTETWFYGFEINQGAKLLKSQLPSKRKIEFYGNSITAGHGVDRPAGMDDSGAEEHFNNYWTYGACTARHYNAQYSCIARSGIGVMISWGSLIMPEMYDRLNPSDPNSKWDFSRYTPDVVVINLFQNDSWLVNNPKHEQFKARFGTNKPTEAQIVGAYRNMVSSIRAQYPQASIICVLGSMDATRQGSLWPGYIEAAVKSMNDSKIYTHFFPFKKGPGHPTVAEQKDMSDDLIKFMDEHIDW